MEEAYRVGQVAVSKAIEGESDRMITLVRKQNAEYQCETGLVDLENVALGRKPVPDGFMNRESNFVTPRFLEYVRPLIGGPLPEYARLRKKVLEKRLLPYP
jgi:6-phosphofructokinase 1